MFVSYRNSPIVSLTDLPIGPIIDLPATGIAQLGPLIDLPAIKITQLGRMIDLSATTTAQALPLFETGINSFMNW
jgi:hypothetical protein